MSLDAKFRARLSLMISTRSSINAHHQISKTMPEEDEEDETIITPVAGVALDIIAAIRRTERRGTAVRDIIIIRRHDSRDRLIFLRSM